MPLVASEKRLEGVRVVKIWDPLREADENLAAASRIPGKCSEGVDAVAIPDDGWGEQWKLAVVPLRRGVPTFCDKPLAMTAKEARKIATIARQTGMPFMSASSPRFVPDVVALAEDVEVIAVLEAGKREVTIEEVLR